MQESELEFKYITEKSIKLKWAQPASKSNILFTIREASK